MDLLNSAITTGLKGYVAAWAWAPPVVGLTVLSVIMGGAMLWVFAKASDLAKLRGVKRKVRASLLEIRVYSDQPCTISRGLKSLIGANFRYFGLSLGPAVLVAFCTSILLIHLEAFYGRRPLSPEHDAIVTAAFTYPVDGARIELITPSEVRVTAPPVRLCVERQVSWRVRPLKVVSGYLQIQINGQTVTKAIEAGGSPRFVAGRRVRSRLSTLWNPDEPHIAATAVESVEIPYPRAYLNVLGFELPWLSWFLPVSILAAFLFRLSFGVDF